MTVTFTFCFRMFIVYGTLKYSTFCKVLHVSHVSNIRKALNYLVCADVPLRTYTLAVSYDKGTKLINCE